MPWKSKEMMNIGSLVFQHRDDPAAQISCEVQGDVQMFGPHQVPIVRCRVTGSGSASASASSQQSSEGLIPLGSYYSPNADMELKCDTAGGPCLLSRRQPSIDPDSDIFAHGMMVLYLCVTKRTKELH
jgi:hypothetical protein